MSSSPHQPHVDLIYKALYAGQYVHTVHTQELCQGRSHFRQFLSSSSSWFTALNQAFPSWLNISGQISQFLFQEEEPHTLYPTSHSQCSLGCISRHCRHWFCKHIAGHDHAATLQSSVFRGLGNLAWRLSLPWGQCLSITLSQTVHAEIAFSQQVYSLFKLPRSQELQ